MNISASMLHARRLELHDHPAQPAGAEVHAAGVRHEVQPGDSATGIARDYATAFHANLTPAQLTSANAAAFADGLHPGELLRIPGLEQRLDTMFLAENPRLTRTTAGLRHTVHSGETLANIARRYNAANGVKLTWQQLYSANRATIGSNPDRLRAGQQLVVPGISTASPKATLKTLSALDQDVVITRTARVQHESGGVETQDVMHFRANASHAERHGSLSQAIQSAELSLDGATGRPSPIAVVQTRDGAFHTVPLLGTEASSGLDHTDRVLSKAYRADTRGLTAVVELDQRGIVTTRRYDR